MPVCDEDTHSGTSHHAYQEDARMARGKLLNNTGALLMAGAGAVVLRKPMMAVAVTNLEPRNAAGHGELRAIYGGFLLALGAQALITQKPEHFRALRLAWGAAAGGRTLSMIADRKNISPLNIGAVAVEAGMAALFLAPQED